MKGGASARGEGKGGCSDCTGEKPCSRSNRKIQERIHQEVRSFFLILYRRCCSRGANEWVILYTYTVAIEGDGIERGKKGMGKKRDSEKKRTVIRIRARRTGGVDEGVREGMRIQKRKRKRSCAREEEERDRAWEQRTD